MTREIEYQIKYERETDRFLNSLIKAWKNQGLPCLLLDRQKLGLRDSIVEEGLGKSEIVWETPIVQLVLARTWVWIESQWNAKMVEFGESESKRKGKNVSYEDLIINESRREELFSTVIELGRSWDELQSVDEILSELKVLLIQTIMRQSITHEDREYLESLLRLRRREAPQMLRQLTGTEFFYFFFCEAREALAQKPNLPPTLGIIFGHGKDHVRDFIESANRKLRGHGEKPRKKGVD